MMLVLITSLLKQEMALTAELIIVRIGLLRAAMAHIFKKPELVTIEDAVPGLVLIIPILKQETAPVAELIIVRIGLFAAAMAII